ncbi:hypothetical protein SBA6_930004 [Candidatus Sulfopaludibacter sp. SbA6]|nr:hypothetical protein SBA6_930004 [Candidatus Sulfopaludibacter sp. SbA6]
MSTPVTTFGETVWVLPPLILHPFNERVPPSTLLENSKAALMLSGLIPSDGSDAEELKRRLLSGRYSEIRMLFFLGKDVFRWLDQCVEWAERVPDLREADIYRQSFAGLLTVGAPESVKEKLVRWGVSDYVSIFSRAIGLNTMFLEPPGFCSLAEEFLRNYHRYADALFQCYQQSQPHRIIGSRNFAFELYASSEYSRLLEAEWGAE